MTSDRMMLALGRVERAIARLESDIQRIDARLQQADEDRDALLAQRAEIETARKTAASAPPPPPQDGRLPLEGGSIGLAPTDGQESHAMNPFSRDKALAALRSLDSLIDDLQKARRDG